MTLTQQLIGEIDREDIKDFFRICHAEVKEEAIDFQVKVEEQCEQLLSADSSMIVCRWKGWSEHHKGELQKIGSSGEEIEETEEFGTSMFGTSQGQIAVIWLIPSMVAWEGRPEHGGWGRLFRNLGGKKKG